MNHRRPRRRVGLAAGAALLAVLLAAPVARADERPSPEERSRIEAALRQLGFASWGEIEREDGGRAWEVDDARRSDGTKYDLELAADDLRVIKQERD